MYALTSNIVYLIGLTASSVVIGLVVVFFGASLTNMARNLLDNL